MPLRFDSRSQPQANRFEYWAHAVSSQVVPVEIDQRDDITMAAGLTSAAIGSTKVIDGFGGNHLFNRTVAGIRAEDPDVLLLAFPISGAPILEQDSRQTGIANGGMVFIDSSRPVQVVMQEPFRWQIFAAPKSDLRLTAAQSQKITAIALSPMPGIRRVVYQALKAIIAESAILEKDSAAAAIGGHATDLIAILIHSTFLSDQPPQGKATVLRERVMSFVRHHHTDPQLTPSLIARAHHVSLRTLHGAFSDADYSLMDTVRNERVEQARRDLTNPRLGGLSLAQVAHAHGFSSPSDFSRTFRSVLGSSPSEYRDVQVDLSARISSFR
ncbi:MAG: helix-turn-helix domain-containing protein [Microbacteriaceae bacterium]|nr:helix-turn-helix domain-containing protein [Microbacteriaceae bacterium]